MLKIIIFLALLLPLECTVSETKLEKEENRWSQCQDPNGNDIFAFQMKTLEGEKKNLSEYRGDVLLIVNVATYCGYTEQYLDFNPLLKRNPSLKILAFPSNQFGLQEPALNHEILNGLRYVRPGNNWVPDEKLIIHAKLEVNGASENPLYTFLKKHCLATTTVIGKKNSMFWEPICGPDITWNFEKFLIDKNGQPRFRFHPAAWQNSKLVQKYIDILTNE